MVEVDFGVGGELQGRIDSVSFDVMSVRYDIEIPTSLDENGKVLDATVITGIGSSFVKRQS